MKKVNKSEPAFYQDYISRNKPGKWKQLSFDIGFDMRTYMLMEEQNFQCAYTEIRLEPEQSALIIVSANNQFLFPPILTNKL
jgi:hypothetical protein